jgi:hypothetical protein
MLSAQNSLNSISLEGNSCMFPVLQEQTQDQKKLGEKILRLSKKTKTLEMLQKQSH